MDGKVKIHGLEEAVNAMEAAFPKDTNKQRSLVNQGLRASAKETILNEAKSRAYSGDSSGALAESLGIRNIPKRRLKARRVAGVYIAPIRFNTKAMKMYADYYRKNSNSLRKVVDGIRHGHLVEFGTRHSAANPFLWPAAQSKAQAYLYNVAENIKKKTQAAVKRAAKKAKKVKK